MSLFELENTMRDNQRKLFKIEEQSTTIQCLQSDNQTLQELIHKQAKQIADLKQTIKSLHKQMQDHQFDREQTESRYFLVLRKLEEELEQYKIKYNKFQTKILPLMDQDTVRLKILNEVEGNHQMELEHLQRVIEQYKDESFRNKREHELTKHRLQNMQMQHEHQVRNIKKNSNQEQSQNQINLLSFEMTKEIQNKFKSSYEQARKEAEFYKDKYFTSEKKYQEKIRNLERQLRHELTLNQS